MLMCKKCGNWKKFRGDRIAYLTETQYITVEHDDNGEIILTNVDDTENQESNGCEDERLDECAECGSQKIANIKNPKKIQKLKDLFLQKQILKKV